MAESMNVFEAYGFEKGCEAGKEAFRKSLLKLAQTKDPAVYTLVQKIIAEADGRKRTPEAS